MGIRYKCSLKAAALQGTMLCLSLFLLYIEGLPDGFICIVVIYAEGRFYPLSVIRLMICSNI